MIGLRFHALSVLVLFLAVGSAFGDVSDVDCNQTSDARITKKFCDAQQWAHEFSDKYINGELRNFGIIMIFIYHALEAVKHYCKKSGVVETYHELNLLDDVLRILRLWAQNLLVYNCYRGNQAHMLMLPGQPFLHSLAWIGIDVVGIYAIRTLFQWYVLDVIIRIRKRRERKGNDDEEGGADDNVKDVEKDVAEEDAADDAEDDDDGVAKVWEFGTIYSLSGVAPLRCWLTFASQSTIFFLYILVMNQMGSEVNDNGEPLVWGFGVLVMSTVGEAQSGDAFDFNGWQRVFDVFWKSEKKKDLKAWRLLWRFAWRTAFDFMVNAVYRTILLATTAILLSTEGPIDFIKDVLAINFISTLDDATDDQQEKTMELFYQVAEKKKMLTSSLKASAKENNKQQMLDGYQGTWDENDYGGDAPDWCDDVRVDKAAELFWEVQSDPDRPSIPNLFRKYILRNRAASSELEEPLMDEEQKEKKESLPEKVKALEGKVNEIMNQLNKMQSKRE